MSGGERRLLGRWGEAQAAAELRRRGYTVRCANFSCRFGEIDLIATNRAYISFTEVKLRKSAAFAQAREFVDRSKQEKLRLAARYYLACHPTRLQPRFDVMEVYAPQGVNTLHPELFFWENAFE